MIFKVIQMVDEEEKNIESTLDSLTGFDKYHAVNVELRKALQMLISSAKAAALKCPEVGNLLGKNVMRAQGALTRAKELELSMEE